MNTPRLETDRLILRPITLTDAPAIQKHFAHWEIIKNLSTDVPWPYPDDGAETFIREVLLPRMEKKWNYVWAITLKSTTEEVVGIVDFGLEKCEGGDRGFWIAQEHQGKGFMTEAITATNDFLFFNQGIERFIVGNASENEASRRVKEKTGAKYLRTINLPHHNGKNETQLWEITKENWVKTRGRDA
jgi:RimJ/RimL family protein N-acetyltransferase